MTEPTRILFVSPYWPHRATCASELRALHTARALLDVADVHVAVVDAEGRSDEWQRQSDKRVEVPFHAPVHAYPNTNAVAKIRWILNPRAKYPHGCGVDEEATKSFSSLAESYDLVWFCKLRTANMFPRWRWANSVVDIDDVPSGFENSVWRREKQPVERAKAWIRYWSWRRRDARLADRFPVLGVCSEPDKAYLRSLGVTGPVHVIPNGYERPSQPLERKLPSVPRLGFIGIFDYEPNREGIRWFVENCWPLVKRQVPEARLRLVGRHSDGPLKPNGPDIDGLGWLEQPDEEIATWSAFLVPIQTGGGTRGKIAHAFSVRCPVVSTALGAYGYDAKHSRDMLLADSPEDFANACVRLIRAPDEGQRLADAAWIRFVDTWTWDAIKPKIWSAAEDALRRGKSKQISRNTVGFSSSGSASKV